MENPPAIVSSPDQPAAREPAYRRRRQFALPGDVVAGVYGTDPRYAGSVAKLADVSLAGDMVFRDNTAAQVAAQTMVMTGDAATGFTATGTIGLA